MIRVNVRGRVTGRHELPMLGLRFGRLVVVGRAPRRGRTCGRYWRCVCDCGASPTVYGDRLRSGRTVSCGCRKREINAGIGATTRTHGEAPNTSPRMAEYDAWCSMKRRCLDPRNTSFKRYGGRGITVCERWRDSYEAFLADVGRRPSPAHSLERVDVDGNYEPGNVVWATPREQARNRTTTIRVVYRGREVSLAEALELGGNRVKRTTAVDRIRNRGWSVERAVEEAPSC